MVRLGGRRRRRKESAAKKTNKSKPLCSLKSEIGRGAAFGRGEIESKATDWGRKKSIECRQRLTTKNKKQRKQEVEQD